MKLPASWIVPDWPAPANVRAFATTREGGVSEGAYGTLNLGMSSGDDPDKVVRNREILRGHLPEMPQWLRQQHGTQVERLGPSRHAEAPVADGVVSTTPGRVCGVLTADCLPLLLCNREGTQVATVHAGWRGLAAGIVENAVATFPDPSRVLAWLGPAIGPRAFEVGPEVREAFIVRDPGAGEAFMPHGPGKHLADLYALARRRLAIAGVHESWGGGFCTMGEPGRFFSYRREKASGRLGTFAWLDPVD